MWRISGVLRRSGRATMVYLHACPQSGHGAGPARGRRAGVSETMPHRALFREKSCDGDRDGAVVTGLCECWEGRQPRAISSDVLWMLLCPCFLSKLFSSVLRDLLYIRSLLSPELRWIGVGGIGGFPHKYLIEPL